MHWPKEQRSWFLACFADCEPFVAQKKKRPAPALEEERVEAGTRCSGS